MKLEKDVVARRILLLNQEGIDFVPNTEIGKDITAEELKTNTMPLSFAQVPRSNVNLISKAVKQKAFTLRWTT